MSSEKPTIPFDDFEICQDCKAAYSREIGFIGLLEKSKNSLNDIQRFLKEKQNFLHDIEQKRLNNESLNENENKITAFCDKIKEFKFKLQVVDDKEINTRKLFYTILIDLNNEYEIIKKLIAEGESSCQS